MEWGFRFGSFFDGKDGRWGANKECNFCAKSLEETLNRSVLKYVSACGATADIMISSQFTLSASPRFFGGVSSMGKLSMKFLNDLHSAGDSKSYDEGNFLFPEAYSPASNPLTSINKI